MSAPKVTDEFLDKCDDAYRAEFERWNWRRKPDHKPGFELVRHVIHDEYEITNLTKRECKCSDDAEGWLTTYRGRAAIQAVLRIVADRTVNSAARRHARLDPLRNNPVVGFMSEEQAERILAEMRGERS